MTDRSSRPVRLALPVLLLGLLLGACSGGEDEADDPGPTTSPSSPTGAASTTSSQEPCDLVDTAALAELAGVEFDPAEPYEEGPNHADGCFVASTDGELSMVVDIRSQHGDLARDLDDFGSVPGKATPVSTTIAGEEALAASGEQVGLKVSAVALHIGERLLLVAVQNYFSESVTEEDGVELATAVAEMVAPAV